MKKLSEWTGLMVPTWALSYVVNGDNSGISESDQRLIDQWWAHWVKLSDETGGLPTFVCGDEEAHFVHKPEFGLACNCVESSIVVIG